MPLMGLQHSLPQYVCFFLWNEKGEWVDIKYVNTREADILFLPSPEKESW